MGLGKVKQYFLILLLIFFTSVSTGQRVNRHKYVFDNFKRDNSIVKSENSLIINYSLSELNVENLLNEAGTFYRLAIPGHIPSTDVGKPELPVLSRLITVPDGYTCNVKISEVRTKRLKPGNKRIEGILYPAQEGETKSPQQKKPEFIIDKDIYSRKGFSLSDTVSVVPIGKVRQKNLSNIFIYPVRYNPKTNRIEVITSMKIEITFSGAGDLKSVLPDSPLIAELLTKGIINYDPDEVIPGYTDSPARMIILTDTSFKKHLEPYIKWKTQKGFKLDVLYKGAEFAGNTYTALKDTIKKIYNSSTSENPPPEYLLIVGDVSKVPYYGTGYITDMYYGEFDGNGDYIPELFIGRLPVSDTNDLKSVVSKIIQYEKFEFADTNRFYSNALITAGSDGGHSVYMNGQVNYTVSNYLTSANNISEFHFLNSVAKRDTILKLINRGLSFINYTGHGELSKWVEPNINSSDVSNFSNRNMYPFVISNACNTSIFNYKSSLGNTMVITNERGAIGFIGCSTSSLWDEDFYWSVGVGAVSENPTYEATGLGALDRLFHTHEEKPSDWYYTMGQINFAGNLAVSSSTSPNKKMYWETYNLVGDPSIIPIIGTPDSFNIVLPDTLPNGIKTYTFSAPPFAYAAVSHFDTLWDASYVSPAGTVTLDMPGLSDDSCLIVITGQNKVPLIKTIYFTEVNSEFINLSASEINDSASNDNGIADFGETFYFSCTINNLGNTAATNLSATLSSASEWLKVNSDSVNIGTLTAGSEVILDNDFSISVSDDVPDNTIAILELTLKDDNTEKQYLINLCMHAPKLDILTCMIDDLFTGDGDLVADPGETFNLVFKIQNSGSSNTSGQFGISSLSEDITINEPPKNSGTLELGKITEIAVPVKISHQVNSGTSISVSAVLNCDPYVLTKNFKFYVGLKIESFELSSFRVFPWINLSSKPWIITQTSSYDGAFSARSGNISHNASTKLSIKTYYSSSDTLKFNYFVSSEPGYDFLSFYMNDTLIFKKSGDVVWERFILPVSRGLKKFEWVFKKDGNDDLLGNRLDCAMIDMIDFTSTGSIRFIEKDLATARIVSPVQKEKSREELVTLKLLNIGPDTINGFNLAYTINGGTPVSQHFSQQVIPFSDSVTVTFNTKADLTFYGIYDLVAYSYANGDDYLLNDTLRTNIENIIIDEPLTIYPNPFINELKILINSNKEGIARISLTSTTGQKMADFEQSIIEGMNEITITDLKLTPSVYYLRIEYPGLSRTFSVVKIK